MIFLVHLVGLYWNSCRNDTTDGWYHRCFPFIKYVSWRICLACPIPQFFAVGNGKKELWLTQFCESTCCSWRVVVIFCLFCAFEMTNNESYLLNLQLDIVQCDYFLFHKCCTVKKSSHSYGKKVKICVCDIFFI